MLTSLARYTQCQRTSAFLLTFMMIQLNIFEYDLECRKFLMGYRGQLSSEGCSIIKAHISQKVTDMRYGVS